jgi:hypothetical protein
VSGFVPEDPLQLAPGVPELLADPNHFRRTEMQVVDYSNAPPADAPWLPSLASPEPEASYWQRLWAALRGKP